MVLLKGTNGKSIKMLLDRFTLCAFVEALETSRWFCRTVKLSSTMLIWRTAYPKSHRKLPIFMGFFFRQTDNGFEKKFLTIIWSTPFPLKALSNFLFHLEFYWTINGYTGSKLMFLLKIIDQMVVGIQQTMFNPLLFAIRTDSKYRKQCFIIK